MTHLTDLTNLTFPLLKTKKFKGRSHWGKSGSIYHGREMLDIKLDSDARNQFIGE